MTSIIQKLTKAGYIKPPTFLPNAMVYECIIGSVAYGVSNDNSDMDIVGICVPNQAEVFPHLAGHIRGFGKQKQHFEQYQQHHIKVDKQFSAKTDNYDISVYNIVKFFNLAMANNPNIVDVLFTPRRCILHSTQVGELIREGRHLFLHKGCWHKFRGYAYSQLNKARNKIKQPVILAVTDFEQEHDISHTIKLADIEQELLTRGIHIP